MLALTRAGLVSKFRTVNSARLQGRVSEGGSSSGGHCFPDLHIIQAYPKSVCCKIELFFVLCLFIGLLDLPYYICKRTVCVTHHFSNMSAMIVKQNINLTDITFYRIQS